MATISFDRQIRVSNKGAQELSRILSEEKPVKRHAVVCKKATKTDIKKLLNSK